MASKNAQQGQAAISRGTIGSPMNKVKPANGAVVNAGKGSATNGKPIPGTQLKSMKAGPIMEKGESPARRMGSPGKK